MLDLVGEDGVEGGGELGVAVAAEELDGVRLGGEFYRDVAGLLGAPAGDRVRRDAGDRHGAAVVVGEDEDVEPAGENGVGFASRRPSALSPGRRGAPPRLVLTFAVTARCRGASGSPRRSRGRSRCPWWRAHRGCGGNPRLDSPSRVGGQARWFLRRGKGDPGCHGHTSSVWQQGRDANPARLSAGRRNPRVDDGGAVVKVRPASLDPPA